ncbi:UDP-galactose:fucoside alpha-3-galactosyltransferase [Quillaja saponaria]|uniref:UDP-galactose:fucoside alpha-3-galactosyltransferase n=1 Tax=Quillaja saponaria TaxID=32244 RepID=A0AAD7L8F0_QUISA|nr:UDP-galactose:fucoside alpha-3-galactosyltransferase [Quillaja saponaria]
MLKRFARLLRLVQCTNIESETSLDLTLYSKNISIKIFHADGREEQYQHAVPASQLMEKYPGMCVARPEVFKNPHESLLESAEYLFPGQKYYIIPSSTAENLKHKHSVKKIISEPQKGKELSEAKISEAPGGENLKESFCSAKEFHVHKERWSRCVKRKGIKGKKPFIPPLPRARTFGVEWEPSLTSVQELSP